MTNLTRSIFPVHGSIDKVWDQFFETPPFQPSRQGLSYQIKSEDDAVIAEVELKAISAALRGVERGDPYTAHMQLLAEP